MLNQTRNFNLNNIVNNFSGGAIVSFNGTQMKSKELKEVKQKLEDGYTGSNNAGKMLVINNPNDEGKVEVIRLQPDNMGDLYKNLQDSSEHDLFVSFRINPMLLGLNESTGFASQEFENAYVLFNTTVIKPIQNNFKKIFNKNRCRNRVQTICNKLEGGIMKKVYLISEKTIKTYSLVNNNVDGKIYINSNTSNTRY